jgi:hypothetical protein
MTKRAFAHVVPAGQSFRLNKLMGAPDALIAFADGTVPACSSPQTHGDAGALQGMNPRRSLKVSTTCIH